MKRAADAAVDDATVSLYSLVKNTPTDPDVCTLIHLLRKGVVLDMLLQLPEAKRVNLGCLYTVEDEKSAGHIVLNLSQIVHVYMCALMEHAWLHQSTEFMSAPAAAIVQDRRDRDARDAALACKLERDTRAIIAAFRAQTEEDIPAIIIKKEI